MIAMGLWTSRSTAGLPKIRVRPIGLFWVLGYFAAIYLVVCEVTDVILGAWGADFLYVTIAVTVAYIAMVKPVSRT